MQIKKAMNRKLKSSLAVLAVITFAAWSASATGQVEDEFAAQRARLVETVAAEAEYVAGRGLPQKFSTEVLDSLSDVLRHEFVPAEFRQAAYDNTPLPIGYGQTISQPYIVALMTDLLAAHEGDQVLEVGTGSGYQAAILAELGVNVYSIEIIPELGEQAAARLQRLGYETVQTRIGDGYYGWPEAAPFDGIVVTAAASHVPPPLVQQLKPGGRMIIPVGPQFMVQQLVMVTKNEDGTVQTRQLLPVAFVPLTGKH